MKKTFPGYFVPQEKELEKLWEEALIILDANFLLNVYRYSDETRDKFISILNKLSKRIWIPYQAAFEYLENRLFVIDSQVKVYNKFIENVKEIDEKIHSSKHPFVDAVILREMDAIHLKLINDLENKARFYERLLELDGFQDKITEFLENRIGSQTDDEVIKEIYKEGEERFKNKIPPGYKDMEKPINKKYGDLILWFQIIEKAKDYKKSILFITGDVKEDWWTIFNGKIKGPRPELISEIKKKGNITFYMYPSDKFLEYANKYLNQKVKENTIDEVKKFNIQQMSDKLLNIPNFAGEFQNYLNEYYKGIEAQRQKIAEMMKSDVVENMRKSISDSLERNKIDWFKVYNETLKSNK
jgi:hypothetical protein